MRSIGWPILVATLILGPVEASAANRSRIEVIKSLEQERLLAGVRKDIQTISLATADDYTQIDFDGNVLDKAATLQRIRSSYAQLQSNPVNEMVVRIYADTAVVTGRATPKGTIDTRNISAVRYTRVYVKRGGRWQVVLFQQTRVASPAVSVATRPGQTLRDCRECPEMVVVPAGGFTIGSPASEPGRNDTESPQRRVSIRKFAVGKFDVTRGEWAAFVSATKRPISKGCVWSGGSSGGHPDPEASWRNLHFPQDDNHPVVCVTWKDAQDYARWLSGRTSHKYRLLTEAEWEYAARAGTATPFPWGSTASHEDANYGADVCCSGLASGRDRWDYTSPAGSFPPNAFGLHDMHGNVLQWVEDCFSMYADLPADGSANETAVQLQKAVPFPYMAGTSSCSYRMLRGGDWGDPPRMIRSAFRNFGPGPGGTLAEYRSGGVGFRVAITLD